RLRGGAIRGRGDTQNATEALAEAHALAPQNKIAAKLYNEALERAHGQAAAEGAPTILVDEVSERVVVSQELEPVQPAPPEETLTEPGPPPSEARRRRRWPWVVAALGGLVLAGGAAGRGPRPARRPDAPEARRRPAPA